MILPALEDLPGALDAALSRFTIHSVMRDVYPRDDDSWSVVDGATADPSVNWPGELVSEHKTYSEARLGLMKAVLDAIGPVPAASTFQARNAAWMAEAFRDDPTDLSERVARFGEEALELQQALGQSREDAHALVDYVFDRPVGEPAQEMGGTKTTLALLAVAAGLDMDACGELELARCSTPEIIAKIKGKRANRAGRGPLPGVEDMPCHVSVPLLQFDALVEMLDNPPTVSEELRREAANRRWR